MKLKGYEKGKTPTITTIDLANIRKNLGTRYIEKYAESIISVIDDNVPEVAEMEAFKNGGYRAILSPYLTTIKKVLIEHANMERLKETTMMVKILRKAYKETTQRYSHSLRVQNISAEIAEKLGLDVELVKIMSRYHDIGHTFYGHDGEYMLSDALKEKFGLGGLIHNAEGTRKLIMRCKIYDKIIEEIKKDNPDIKPWKLRIIRDNLWVIFDGILTHNGELSSRKFIPEVKKTEADFLEELGACYTNTTDKVDRHILPATSEGCLLRISDIISYVGMDLADGRRECLITGLDKRYEEILIQFGVEPTMIEKIRIADEEIRQKKENATSEEELTKIELEERKIVNQYYMPIEKIIREAIINDVVVNSNKNEIKMSARMAQLVYEGLRKQNEDKIVNKVSKRTELGAFPTAIEKIMREGAQILLEEKIISSLNENADNVSSKIDEVINKSYFSSQEYEPFKQLLQFVKGTNSLDYEFTRQIAKIQFQNASKIMKQKEKLTLDRTTAILITAQFLASLKDKEFVELIQNTEGLTKEQYSDLHVQYKDTQNYEEKTIWQKNLEAERKKEAQQGFSLNDD